MDAATAAEKINAVHFMPGWDFEAMPAPGYAGAADAVRMRVLIDTHNSNRECALAGYPASTEITVAPETAFDAGALRSEDELYALLIKWAQEVFEHEAREFLRVGEDMDAPFHPHKDSGNARWSSVTR